MKKVFKVVVKGSKKEETYNVCAESAHDCIYKLASYNRPNKDKYDAPENKEWENHVYNDISSITMIIDNVIDNL